MSDMFHDIMQDVLMCGSVRDWYIVEYPDDELGEALDPYVAFHDVFSALDNYQDIYDTLGVGDSVVRERVFRQLAAILEVPYDYIYDQWLKSV